MSIETWLYYLLAVLILAASPGPSILLCLTKSVTEGFQASIFTALGSLTGIVGLLTLSFTGLGVVITSSELLFDTVKWVGAAYLIFLGYKAFTSKEHSYEVLNKKHNPSMKTSRFSLFTSGFIVGASNPKAIVFFTALFPQFINLDKALLQQYFIFAFTFAVIELSWLLIYAYLGSKSSNWLTQKGRARVFNRVTGGVFIGAGLLLSTTNKT